LGSAASIYYTLKALRKAGRWLRDFIQSFWNSKKYLSSCAGGRDERYYAVIYGAGNKAGKIFAQELALKHDFNLILIDNCRLGELADDINTSFIN